MTFSRARRTWFIGCLAVTLAGLLLLPQRFGPPHPRWPMIVGTLAAISVLSLGISLAVHAVASAWNRWIGPRRFTGISRAPAWFSRVLEDALQVLEFFNGSMAFGTILQAIVLAVLTLRRP
jgi:hypothetical protein